MEINGKDIKLINSNLQDELSKLIFENRLMYSMTKDTDYLSNVCKSKVSWKRMIQFLEMNEKREKVLFATGRWAKWIVETYKSIKWDYCSDNNKESDFMGIKYITAEELVRNHKDACVVITAKYDYRDIYKQLINDGMEVNQVICFGELEEEAERGIYFDLPQLKNSGREVFADVGGYDGKTSIDFNKWTNGSGRILFFEPNKAPLKEAQERLKNLTNVSYIEKGLYSKTGQLKFELDGTGSRINEDGETIISVTSLDDYLGENGVTFLKMDIEGAELEALIGAKETIKKNKPKMAISIYHKPEDVIEIPKMILSISEEYKFWIRHYSLTWFDTVLYAI